MTKLEFSHKLAREVSREVGFWMCVVIAWFSSLIPSASGDVFAGISLSPRSFNPISAQKVELSVTINLAERVTIKVFDPDGGLVQTLDEKAKFQAGKHQLVWDGKDWAGNVVPDEAYTFILEAATGEVYDPPSFSGGEVGDVKEVGFSKVEGTVDYKLPAASRVLIRLGIKNGPMHRTLVDWRPRPAGAVTDYWDGLDEDKVVNIRDHKDFSGIVTYVTLPAATVITYGNTNETYREYKLGRGKDRPQKPKRERKPESQVLTKPTGLVPPAWARSPKVAMSFPKNTNSPIPDVSGTIDVRVDVAEADKDELLKGQFEVMFFVDNVFFAEAERGYLPYNWRWELQQLPAGEHLLTVNVSSFKGQVGAASRKVKVLKPNK